MAFMPLRGYTTYEIPEDRVLVVVKDGELTFRDHEDGEAVVVSEEAFHTFLNAYLMDRMNQGFRDSKD